jgi:hypothetical protein
MSIKHMAMVTDAAAALVDGMVGRGGTAPRVVTAPPRGFPAAYVPLDAKRMCKGADAGSAVECEGFSEATLTELCW